MEWVKFIATFMPPKMICCRAYIYTEPQNKSCTKKYNSQFLHLYNEIVYMCNDKILVQR